MNFNRAFQLLLSTALRAGAPFVLLLWVGCSSSTIESADNGAEEQTGPVLENMVARVYTASALEIELQATSAVVDFKKKEIDLKSVLVTFHEESGRSADLSSDTGVMYLEDRPDENIGEDDFFLSGHVEYKGEKGATISSPEVRYSSRDEKIVSGGGAFRKRFKMNERFWLCTGKWFEVNKSGTEFVDHGAHLRMDKDR